jgi:polysaccharide biosynthesis transport protein
MKEQITESKMHALDYWQVLRNRWGVILLTFFLVALASLVIVALLDKKFSGHTEFQIHQSAAPDLFQTERNVLANAVGANWLETEFQTITSDETLKMVVRKLNLTSRWGMVDAEAVEKLGLMIEMEQRRGTELVSVTALSTNAQEAAEIANAVRQAYEERRNENERTRIKSLTDTVEAKIRAQTGVVDSARKEMLDLAKKHGIIDISAGNPYAINGNTITPQSSVLQSTMMSENELEQQVMKLQTTLESLKGLQGKELIESAKSLNVQDSTLELGLPELHKFESELAAVTAGGLGENHPSVKSLRAQIVDKRKNLESAVISYKASLDVTLRQSKAYLADAKKLTQNRKEDQLEDRNKQSEYNIAKSNYEQQTELLKTMRESALKTAVDQGVARKPIEVQREATAETNPSRPKVGLLLGIGSALGLILGLVLAFFLEYLDTSVKSLDDVERYLGVPVLAVIPKDVGVLHKQSGLSPDAEAYRILRTNIEFNRRSADANAITVVSGGAGEGKSTTLVNLAYICAQGGYNTLMIDGDLRRPKLHTFFDINNSVGLTNYLTTALTLEDVILQTPIENLYFMPSGILPADAAGILNSRRMSELIADVKNRFDLVLIDSPPILGVSDASVLSSEVDLTIIVIQHRKLPRNMLMRVKQAIENVGGNLLGVVLNNVDVRSDSQYQYYTSYYTYYSPTNMDNKPRNRATAPSAEPAGEIKTSRPTPAPMSGDDNY